MIDVNAGLQAFLDEHPDIEIFEIIVPDVCGGLRGKWVTRDKIHKVFAGELKLPLSSLAFDVWGRDGEKWVFESGDGDGFCDADLATLAPPRRPRTARMLAYPPSSRDHGSRRPFLGTSDHRLRWPCIRSSLEPNRRW